jgi:MraZ protein
VKTAAKWNKVVHSGKRWDTERQVMLLGQYDGKIDAKGRTAFPKKFREVLGDKLIVTLGYENSLIIVSEENWKALLEGTEGRPFIESETRETQRFLLGGASNIELDGKGRFVLPAYLREFAGVEDDVVFIGLSRYVEIWDKGRWLIYRKGLEKNIDSISKRLAKKEGDKGDE